MTTYLVSHPDATFLIDPALCHDVRRRVLPAMPAPMRALLGGGADGPGIGELLEQHDVDPAGIDFAIATHSHWDHVSGAFDLPTVPFRVSAEEAGAHNPITGLYDAVAPEAFALDGPPVLLFERSHDLFGDDSVVAVSLPGHTPGSIGVLLALADGVEGAGPDRRVLLCGDAVWHADQIRYLRQKAPLPGAIVDQDRREAFRTLHRLHAAADQVTIVPAHDADAARRTFT